MAAKPQTLQQVQANVPFRVLSEIQSLVDAGWFQSVDEVITAALRKFIDSHRSDLMQDFIREDVDWGLRGAD